MTKQDNLSILHAFIFFSIKFAGGTSDLMFKICKAQVKQGNKPTIYSGDYCFDKELADSLQGVEFKVVRSFLNKFGFSIMPHLPRLVTQDISSHDIVHMHVFRTFQNVILYKYCKKYGIPYIIDAHGAVPYHSKKKFLKFIFDYIWGFDMLRNAAFLVAETQVGVDEYLNVLPDLDENKIVVISPPFDTDEFATLPEYGAFREKYRVPSDKKIVMFLGRINYIKGVDFLLKGFAELAKVRSDVVLMIVGSDDGHAEECKALAKKLDIDELVTFTGFIGGVEKNEALVDADIVVQTSRHEQGAWAPFEAVLCGTPIIVSAHTGAGEDVRRINAGETVELDDMTGLSIKLNDIMESYSTAKNKTLAAKSFIEKHMSMNARVKEYSDLYHRAIKKPNNRN